MIKRIFVIGLLGYWVIGLLGCTGMLKRNKGIGGPALLEPQAMLKFSDIPVPVGFKLLAQDSYSFESSGVRVGILKYQGKADVERVVSFYKEQMPMYNWDLLNIVEYGQRLLNFDRDNESCIINLIPKGRNITVTISLGPKSQLRKRVDKPVK